MISTTNGSGRSGPYPWPASRLTGAIPPSRMVPAAVPSNSIAASNPSNSMTLSGPSLAVRLPSDSVNVIRPSSRFSAASRTSRTLITVSTTPSSGPTTSTSADIRPTGSCTRRSDMIRSEASSEKTATRSSYRACASPSSTVTCAVNVALMPSASRAKRTLVWATSRPAGAPVIGPNSPAPSASRSSSPSMWTLISRSLTRTSPLTDRDHTPCAASRRRGASRIESNTACASNPMSPFSRWTTCTVTSPLPPTPSPRRTSPPVSPSLSSGIALKSSSSSGTSKALTRMSGLNPSVTSITSDTSAVPPVSPSNDPPRISTRSRSVHTSTSRAMKGIGNASGSTPPSFIEISSTTSQSVCSNGGRRR